MPDTLDPRPLPVFDTKEIERARAEDARGSPASSATASRKDDAQFMTMVAYFWHEKEDPTRYVGWNETRCRELMPAFFAAWTQYKAFRQLTTLAANSAEGAEDA